MTGTIDITCTVPAPTLEQVRAWLTRTGWEVDTSPLARASQHERWTHPVHNSAWVPREELADWLTYIPSWIVNRAWQIDATPESVYREIVGPTHAEAKLEAIGDLLAENGCDCDCNRHPEEHDGDCERCLACRVSAVRL